MLKLFKFALAPALVAAGLAFAAPNTAQAQGFSIRIGGYSGYGFGGSSYYNTSYSSFGPRRGVSFYYGSPRPTYSRNYYAPRVNYIPYRAPVYGVPAYGRWCY